MPAFSPFINTKKIPICSSLHPGRNNHWLRNPLSKVPEGKCKSRLQLQGFVVGIRLQFDVLNCQYIARFCTMMGALFLDTRFSCPVSLTSVS